MSQHPQTHSYLAPHTSSCLAMKVLINWHWRHCSADVVSSRVWTMLTPLCLSSSTRAQWASCSNTKPLWWERALHWALCLAIMANWELLDRLLWDSRSPEDNPYWLTVILFLLHHHEVGIFVFYWNISTNGRIALKFGALIPWPLISSPVRSKL